MPDIDVQFRATPGEALEFMTQLARDDAFREKVAANPVAMLAAYNIHIVPPEGKADLAAAEAGLESPGKRTEAFGDWAKLCDDRVRSLEKAGFTHQSLLPPKHVVEEALVNIGPGNEFGAPPKNDFEGIDPFGFWLLFPLTVT